MLGCDREGFTEEVSFLEERVVTGYQERMGRNFEAKGRWHTRAR